jgi:hypothetical protein
MGFWVEVILSLRTVVCGMDVGLSELSDMGFLAILNQLMSRN